MDSRSGVTLLCGLQNNALEMYSVDVASKAKGGEAPFSQVAALNLPVLAAKRGQRGGGRGGGALVADVAMLTLLSAFSAVLLRVIEALCDPCA